MRLLWIHTAAAIMMLLSCFGGRVGAQRCDGQLYFRLWDDGVIMYRDSVRSGLHLRSKTRIPGTHYHLRLSREGHAVRSIARIAQRGMYSIEAGCGGDFLLDILRGSPRGHMQVMFRGIPDRHHYLDIPFQEGTYAVSIPELEQGSASMAGNESGYILMAPNWDAARINQVTIEKERTTK